MKKLVFVVGCLFMSQFSFAEYSESAFSKYEHHAWAAAGFTEGGFSLGGDYEYSADRTYGIGGLTRFYQQDDDRNGAAPGIFMFGGFIRPHFHRRSWDLFVTAGLAVVSIENDAADEDATTLGNVFGVGILYQVSESVAVGIESLGTYVMFDDDFRGKVMDDALFRVRFSF